MSKKYNLFFLPLAIILLAGCYSRPQPQTDISVVMKNNGFAPAGWRVPAGATITLHLANQDAIPHDWTVIFRQSTTPASTVDPANVFWQVSVPAGQSETVQFTAPAAAGNYQIVCSQELAEGMVGMLTVVRLDGSK